MSSTQHIDVTVLKEENEYRGLDVIIASLRPKWPKDKVKYQPLTGGLVNVLMCCYLDSDVDKDDALVVRIYSTDNAEGQLIDRDQEVIGVQIAHATGTGVPLNATFNNGMVTPFGKGVVLDRSELFKEDFQFSKITDTLARLHNVDTESLQLVDRHGKPTHMRRDQTTTNMLQTTVDWFSNYTFTDSKLKSRFEKDYWSQMEVQKEVKEIEGYLDELQLPFTRTHMDFHLRNFLFDPAKDYVTLLDFEFFCIAPEAMDLAAIMYDRELLIAVGFITEESPRFEKELSKNWIRRYMETRNELKGEKRLVSETELEIAWLEHMVVAAYIFLFWAIYPLQVLQQTDFKAQNELVSEDNNLDFLEFAFVSRNIYLTNHQSRVRSLMDEIRTLKQKAT